MSFIAIDIGATFIKSARLDLASFRILDHERTPMPDFAAGRKETWRELPADDVVTLVRAEIERLRGRDNRVEGIVLCGQMHGLVLCDARGNPASPFISWQDQRATEPHPSGRGTILAEMLSRLTPAMRLETGNEIRAGFPAANLFWMREHGQSTRALFPASLLDFVVARLCGVAPSTEPTNAAAHGVLDLRRREWHREAIAALGLDEVLWPEVRQTGDRIATFEGIPVFTPVGDQQAALLGALLTPGELSINIATGSQVSCIEATFATGDFQVRPFFDGRFLRTITHVPAGRALNRLVGLVAELGTETMSQDDAWRIAVQRAEAIKETDLEVNLAFFPSVVGDRGAISNAHEGNLTVGHLFRAAFQSMSRNYVRLAARLGARAAWNGIVFSGGLARRVGLLRSIISSDFDLPFRVSPCDSDTLLGLMALAVHVTGREPSVEAAVAKLLERDAAGHVWIA